MQRIITLIQYSEGWYSVDYEASINVLGRNDGQCVQYTTSFKSALQKYRKNNRNFDPKTHIRKHDCQIQENPYLGILNSFFANKFLKCCWDEESR